MEKYNCKSCSKELSLDSFPPSKQTKRGRGAVCRKCLGFKRKEIMRSNKISAIEYKGGKCHDCNGVFHQSAYDFHHLNPVEKDMDPSQLIKDGVNGLSDKAKEELDKCVLLCANCHRIRHYNDD